MKLDFTMKVFTKILLLGMIISGIGFGLLLREASQGIQELFTENKRLQSALSNLKDERQIGYMSVLRQEEEGGELWTTVKFVETSPENRAVKVSERVFRIKGDVVYVDSIVIKFAPHLVESGEEKALYMLRRIYGEKQSPYSAPVLNDPGLPLPRYEEVFRVLQPGEQKAFWEQIWLTAHEPQRLEKLGIQAIYGEAIYTQVRPSYLYYFKINSSGQIYPEILPGV